MLCCIVLCSVVLCCSVLSDCERRCGAGWAPDPRSAVYLGLDQTGLRYDRTRHGHILYYPTPYYPILYHTILHYTILHYTKSHHTILSYHIISYSTSYHAILCYDIPSHSSFPPALYPLPPVYEPCVPQHKVWVRSALNEELTGIQVSGPWLEIPKGREEEGE